MFSCCHAALHCMVRTVWDFLSLNINFLNLIFSQCPISIQFEALPSVRVLSIKREKSFSCCHATLYFLSLDIYSSNNFLFQLFLNVQPAFNLRLCLLSVCCQSNVKYCSPLISDESLSLSILAMLSIFTFVWLIQECKLFWQNLCMMTSCWIVRPL